MKPQMDSIWLIAAPSLALPVATAFLYITGVAYTSTYLGHWQIPYEIFRPEGEEAITLGYAAIFDNIRSGEFYWYLIGAVAAGLVPLIMIAAIALSFGWTKRMINNRWPRMTARWIVSRVNDETIDSIMRAAPTTIVIGVILLSPIVLGQLAAITEIERIKRGPTCAAGPEIDDNCPIQVELISNGTVDESPPRVTPIEWRNGYFAYLRNGSVHVVRTTEINEIRTIGESARR